MAKVSKVYWQYEAEKHKSASQCVKENYGTHVNLQLWRHWMQRNCSWASQGGTVAIHFIIHSWQTLYFTFSSLQIISYVKSNYVIPYKQEEVMVLVGLGGLTTVSPILSLVKISWLIQGAVPALCSWLTGSLLISYLSGEAVIIWGWASTMDNYPGKGIQTVETMQLSARRSKCTKHWLAISRLPLHLSICPFPQSTHLQFGPTSNSTVL